MPAERGRAALLDCRHDLELTQAHMPGVGLAPGGSMAMKDVCDLQPRAAHGRPATCRIAVSRRSMVRAGRGGWLQPGSWYWRRGCKAPWCRVWHGPEVSELDANIDILLEEVGGETVLQCVWRHALLWIPAARAAASGRRGTAGGPTAARPGCGRRETASLPQQHELRRRPSRHQARSSSSSCGDSIAWRSFRAPLPRINACSSMRSESISPTQSATFTSETRSSAPPAFAGAG